MRGEEAMDERGRKRDWGRRREKRKKREKFWEKMRNFSFFNFFQKSELMIAWIHKTLGYA